MHELDVEDVINRLYDLNAYSVEVSTRLAHEKNRLPENPAAYFIEKIEFACARYENATEADRADAQEELTNLLVQSYRFYLERLLLANNVWRFRFPKSEAHTHH